MSSENKKMDVVDVISNAIKVPGVKVDREAFLAETFKNKPAEIKNKILTDGPIAAGCGRAELKKIAKGIVNELTLTSAGISFAAGLPGGWAVVATIPADTLQFFGVALKLAQEISYLYGGENLWSGDDVDINKVKRQLVLYCGVMFGVSGAGATLRVLSSALGKQALKKLPRMALTKTFLYPIVKSIAKAAGVKMTKAIFAKGVSKIVPVLGGVFSSGITLATMHPMGMKLVNSFDEAKFAYSQQSFETDWEEISDEFDIDASKDKRSVAEQIKEAKALFDDGIISEEEFNQIKESIISKL